MTLEEVRAAGGYSVVLADPPWSYRSASGRGVAENHYSTMSDEEIFALPVERIAARDSVLFLWGTWPKMPEALVCIRRWGFAFKTLAFTWIKHYEQSEKPCWGGGRWTRSNEEFCLLGTRGRPKRVSAGVHQLIEEWTPEQLRAPRGAHSEKPEEARRRIEVLMGDVPRIELFARTRVEGWDAWGNQVPGGSDVELTPETEGERHGIEIEG